MSTKKEKCCENLCYCGEDTTIGHFKGVEGCVQSESIDLDEYHDLNEAVKIITNYYLKKICKRHEYYEDDEICGDIEFLGRIVKNECIDYFRKAITAALAKRELEIAEEVEKIKKTITVTPPTIMDRPTPEKPKGKNTVYIQKDEVLSLFKH